MKCNLYGKNIINLELNEEVIKSKNTNLSNNIIKFFKTGNTGYIKRLTVVLPKTDKGLDRLYKKEIKEKRNAGIDSLKSILPKEDIVTYRNLNTINEGLATYFIMKKTNCDFEPEVSKKLDSILNIYCNRIENSKLLEKTL